jgi:site-specific recombinase XerD
LRHFLRFVNDRSIPFEAVFTPDTLAAFRKETRLTHLLSAITGLSRRLFEQGSIPRPIEKPHEKLPEVYEEYLLYYAKSRQVHPAGIVRARKMLTSLNHCLERSQVDLGAIRIEQVDAFLADYGARFTPVTKQNHRSSLRGFLRYLYQERGILKKNLAPLVIGAVLFAQARPPRFLRPQEVQRLFSDLDLSSSHGLRSYAMLYLAFTLGLRPKEIALLTLDDVSFRGLEITLRNRKGNNPIRLPLPEDAVKAIAAYVVGARPETKERALFLNLKAPCRPVSAVTVSQDIGLIMRKKKLPSSAYWLRHTYAQNLLESGTSIFEIKEMLGHDNIQTTERYLHIHTKLMREALFNETL